MAKQLYLVDTCSFVQQYHYSDCAKQIDELIVRGQFVLSAIVAMELYAGTRDHKAKKALDILSLKLDEAGLRITPTYHDYQKAGIILKNYSKRKGAIKSSTHFRDILICLNALRLCAIVITENKSDFIRWGDEIKHLFHKDVMVQSWKEI